MRIVAALKGNLEEFMADELATSAEAMTEGLKTTANRVKVAERRDVVKGGLGRRLARSWQSKTWPRNGASLGAAASVYTKAPVLIRAFEEGATIRSSDGFWLAIPTPSAPKLGTGRKRINPSNFPEHRYGRLRFVYRPSGVSLLVVDGQRQNKKGNFVKSRSKKAQKTGQGLATVPMFYLVRQTRLKRRLNSAAIADREARHLAADIDAAFGRLSRDNG